MDDEGEREGEGDGPDRSIGEKVPLRRPEQLIDETEKESFPASDPPESYHVD